MSSQPVLYHASINKSLKIIEPRRTLSHDEYIGDYIFATSSAVLAAMYLAPKGYGLLMGYDQNPPWLIVAANPHDFSQKDRGGAIYTVPATTFIKSPQKGLESSECVSKSPVKPLTKKIYKTSVDTMREHGILVYFVDDVTFAQLQNNGAEQRKFFASTKPS